MAIPASTSTATATGNPTARNARELPTRRMGENSTHAHQWQSLEKGVINSSAPT
jgi:hypothetical protein